MGSKYVKMHDVVRDVAIYIASKNDQICTLSYGKGLDIWREEDTHGHYTAVFANCINFHDLPKKLRFPKLEVLSMVDIGYGEKVEFPEEFFKGMEKLKVLHLESMKFPQPPSSFCCMVNLRTLVLIDCELESIDIIVELKNLEILDISGSKIRDLPSSTSQLSRLKELNLSDCDRLKVIQPEVILKLTKLEALLVNKNFYGWDTVEGSKKENASLAELQHLPYLTTLYISIQNVKQIPKNAFSNNSKLNEFQIMICDDSDFDEFYVTKKALEINMLQRKKNDRNLFLEEGVRMLLKKAEEVILIKTFGLKDALLELNGSDVLKILELKYDEDVEFLVSSTENEKVSIFPNLEKLHIDGMKRLDRIIRIGFIEKVKVFENLKKMSVVDCDKLKYIFPLSIVEGLFNLESIVVINCKMLEAIVLIDQNEDDEQKLIQCSQLRSLTMSQLPQFMSICCKIVEVDAIETEIVDVDQNQIVANLMTPLDGEVVFPNLKYLAIDRVKNLWDSILNGDYNFMNLETIDFFRENVKNIFTHNTMKMVKGVENLGITSCDSLEEIFNMNEGDDDDVIPSMTRLDVHNCGKLRRIFPTSITKHLHQLQTLTIQECEIVEVFSSTESETECSKVSFPNLELLKVCYSYNLEMIWQNGLIVDNLSNLKSITLVACKSLKSVVTLNELRLLEQLEELFISRCDSLEEIFTIYQKLPQPRGDSISIKFKLKKITLDELPYLKQVWKEDFDGICHFPNLEEVKVFGCPKLRNPFPTLPRISPST